MRNEAETRAELIDPAIKAGGWGEIAESRVGREYQVTPGRIRGKGMTCAMYVDKKLQGVECGSG